MIQIIPFSLPLKNSFKTAKGIIDHRNGVLIHYSIYKSSYYAEISPLPGFSVSDLQSCILTLNSNSEIYDDLLTQIWKLNFKKNEFNSIIELINFSADWRQTIKLPEFTTKSIPEVDFAIDHLVFQILLDRSEFQADFNKINLPINANVKSIEDAIYANTKGFNTVKIKAGMNPDQEYTFIKQIRESLPNISIRLDANEAWDFNEASKFISKVSSLNIEYIEQPVSDNNLKKQGKDLRNLGILIAADESARTYRNVLDLIESESIDVLILKPPMLGSLSNLISIFNLASKNQIPCVFTSTLDSTINRRFAAFLASIFGSPNHAHGFGTGAIFSHDLMSDQDLIYNGELNLQISDLLIADIDPNSIIYQN